MSNTIVSALSIQHLTDCVIDDVVRGLFPIYFFSLISIQSVLIRFHIFWITIAVLGHTHTFHPRSRRHFQLPSTSLPLLNPSIDVLNIKWHLRRLISISGHWQRQGPGHCKVTSRNGRKMPTLVCVCGIGSQNDYAKHNRYGSLFSERYMSRAETFRRKLDWHLVSIGYLNHAVRAQVVLNYTTSAFEGRFSMSY